MFSKFEELARESVATYLRNRNSSAEVVAGITRSHMSGHGCSISGYAHNWFGGRTLCFDAECEDRGFGLIWVRLTLGSETCVFLVSETDELGLLFEVANDFHHETISVPALARAA